MSPGLLWSNQGHKKGPAVGPGWSAERNQCGNVPPSNLQQAQGLLQDATVVYQMFFHSHPRWFLSV